MLDSENERKLWHSVVLRYIRDVDLLVEHFLATRNGRQAAIKAKMTREYDIMDSEWMQECCENAGVRYDTLKVYVKRRLSPYLFDSTD